MDFEGRLDIHSGSVTDLSTGKVHESLREYTRYVHTEVADHHRELVREERIMSSDMQNLPGTKPYFEDDWYGIIPRVRRPRASSPPVDAEDLDIS